MKENEGIPQVLEVGAIHFFHRPLVGHGEPEGLDGVLRFQIVMLPKNGRQFRHILIGQRTRPSLARTGGGRDRLSGWVNRIAEDPEDIRRELADGRPATDHGGEAGLSAARPGGEGVYAIFRHGDDTHMAYSLEAKGFPVGARMDPVIGEQGSFVLSVRNPQVATPFKIGLGVSRQAKLPEHLRKIFQGRRFAAADPPEFLDYEKVELLLIGAYPDPEVEPGMGMGTEEENWNPVEVFQDLMLRIKQDRSNPFLEGSSHRSLLPLGGD